MLARAARRALVLVFRDHAPDCRCCDLSCLLGMLENRIDEVLAGRDVLLLELCALGRIEGAS